MIEQQDLETEIELYEHKKIVVDKGQSLLRIDKFLSDRLPNASRNRIQSAIKNNFVLVNGKNVTSNHKIHPLDEISIVLPTPPCMRTVEPEDIPLDIIYEDDQLLVVNKPVDMVVHPGYNNWNGTLANALLFHVNNLPKKDNIENRPGLVHRIDKDTSGLLLVAKTEDAMTFLAKQFYHHTVDRSYVCLVWGSPKTEAGTINSSLAKSPRDRRIVIVDEKNPDAKIAITHYKILKNYKYLSLLECKLETGRTHQIRAHMQSIGCPIFGDTVYGGNQIITNPPLPKFKTFVENCLLEQTHQMLHAKTLGFTHPKTGERMLFEVAPPEKFNNMLEKWEKYIVSSLKNLG